MRNGYYGVVWLGMLAAVLLAPGSLQATIIEVPADQPTIQAGIAAAAAGDTVLLAPGVFTGAGNTDLAFGGKDIVLQGAAAPDSSAIDCAGANSGFYFNDGETAAARIERLTIKNANGYAIHLYQASASLKAIRVFDCAHGVAFHTSTSFVDGLLCVRTGDALSAYAAVLDATDVTVLQGQSSAAVTVSSGAQLVLDGLTVIDSHAHYGIVECSADLTLRNAYIEGCTISPDLPQSVILCRGGASADLQWITLVDNQGQGIQTEYGPSLLARNVTIVGQEKDGFHLRGTATADISQAIVVFSGHLGLRSEAGCSLSLACSDFYANELGDFGGSTSDPTGTNGMIKADPMFCQLGGPEAPPTLSVNSPCAPANNDCGLLMGAQDTDCALEMVTVSGAVRDALDQPMAEVSVTGFYSPVLTDSSGAYSFSAVQGWSGVLHPVKESLHFEPTDLVIASLAGDLPDQDFLAFAQTAIWVPGDFADLASAIDFALDGDTIFVAPGTYSGPANRDLRFAGKALAVIGVGGPEGVVIDCDGAGRAFLFDAGETAVALLASLTIRNGQGPDGHSLPYDSGGGVCVRAASPTLRDLVIEDCRSREWGGGLMLESAGSLVERVHCRRNEAAEDLGLGGGACVSGGSVTLRDCLFTDNFARRYGGGLFLQSGTVHVEGCTLVGNTAGWSGGGIGSYHCSNPPLITVSRSLLAFNHATSGGALYHHGAVPAPAIDCCLFWANDAPPVWGSIVYPVGSGGNIEADPLLCDPGGGDFGLLAGSPCLPANNGCGVLIGALGEGCDRQTTGGRR